MQRKCTQCKKDKNYSDFYFLKKTGKPMYVCKICSIEKAIQKNIKIKKEKIRNRVVLFGETYRVSSLSKNYEVSNFGNVWSVKHSCQLKGVDNRGYRQIKMVLDNGSFYSTGIHRMVAIEFIPNPLRLIDVHHKNYIKTCNYDWNLQWVTRQQNVQDSWDTGHSTSMCGEKHPQAKFTNNQVICFRNMYLNGSTVSDIADSAGCNYYIIYNLIKKRTYGSV